MLKRIGLLAGALAVMGLAASDVTAARPAAPARVGIKEFKFGPPALTGPFSLREVQPTQRPVIQCVRTRCDARHIARGSR